MKTNITAYSTIIALLIVSTSLSSCSSVPQLTTEASIDAIMAEYAAPNIPGAAVLVMDKDSVVFRKAYGLADVNDGIPVTTATNFRLASVTKQFTAMAVLLLKEQGKLSLEDKILKFFPDFPLYGKEITVRMLLNHTSGVWDYEAFVPDTQTAQVLDKDCLSLMFQAESLYFPAGTRYQYSNTGYALLALIVERTSGQRFADFVQQQIFSRAGMTTTVAYENGISVVDSRAYGHSLMDSIWSETDQSNTSAVLGDGGIYSNVEDMARWISAMWNFRFLSEALQREAWSDAKTVNGEPIPYGMGWHTETYRNVHHPHHAGSTRGFRNHILVFPDRKFMVVILTNRNQGTPITQAKRIADLWWPAK